MEVPIQGGVHLSKIVAKLFRGENIGPFNVQFILHRYLYFRVNVLAWKWVLLFCWNRRHCGYDASSFARSLTKTLLWLRTQQEDKPTSQCKIAIRIGQQGVVAGLKGPKNYYNLFRY